MKMDLTSLKEEFLKGKKRYVWKGYLHFNTLKVEKDKIHIINDGVKLVTYYAERSINFERGESLTFVISDGKMKIEAV